MLTGLAAVQKTWLIGKMFAKESASQTLVSTNPWLVDREQWPSAALRMMPARYIPRTQAGLRTDAWTRHNRAHLVVGPRQTGKSTLIWRHLLGLQKPPVVVNAEHAIFREAAQNAPLFLDWLRTIAPHPQALFIEEAQHIEEAGLFIKGLVDLRPGWPILVTGSSAYDLRARTRESLAGRASRATLWPLSAEEILERRDGEPSGIVHHRMSEILQRHLVFGGYPSVWLANGSAETELGELYEAFVIRDASDTYKIPNTAPFRRLLRLAARQIGNLVNFSEWGAIVELERRKVAQYIALLEEAHVVGQVDPYVGGKRAELTGTPKLYFADNGLRNIILGNLTSWEVRPDQGPLFENFVFAELRKHLPRLTPIRYWRTSGGAEVDFVIEHANQLIGIEVKVQARAPRLPRSVRSFINVYKPSAFWIVHLGSSHRDTLDQTAIQWMHPDELVPTLRCVLTSGGSMGPDT